MAATEGSEALATPLTHMFSDTPQQPLSQGNLHSASEPRMEWPWLLSNPELISGYTDALGGGYGSVHMCLTGGYNGSLTRYVFR
ncbi:Hypothetical predicted protein [Pelobates cultripes]|uniref:Uncharacterized protein n=1 Tax=Pelobates cultripes TaxID=61616 RepID=A0AAD1SVP1_PELCU|nr:Hypothetical predicted protein [Pelobates cultripes]